jgi:hypothetical protein
LVDKSWNRTREADSAVSSVPDDDFLPTLGQDSPFEHLGPETCELSKIVYVNDDAVQ